MELEEIMFRKRGFTLIELLYWTMGEITKQDIILPV